MREFLSSSDRRLRLPRTSSGYLVVGLLMYAGGFIVGTIGDALSRSSSLRAPVGAAIVIRTLVMLFLVIQMVSARGRRRVARYLLVVALLSAGLEVTAAVGDGMTAWRLVSLAFLGLMATTTAKALQHIRHEPTDADGEARLIRSDAERYAVLQKQAFAQLRRQNNLRSSQ